MANKPIILAANHDVGSAQAMIPALKVLSQDFKIVPVAWPESPAFVAFQQAGLEPHIFSAWRSQPREIIEELLFGKLKPVLVLLGISTTDQGPETLILEVKNNCMRYEIPIAFIYET